MNKILLMTDGSENALRAVEEAKLIQEKFDCHVILGTVLPDSGEITIPAAYRVASDSTYNISKKETEVKLNRIKVHERMEERAATFPNPEKVTVMVLSGEAVTEIVDLAKKQEVDWIIVGSRGLGGIRKALMGSVSSGVANKAHCSVLIVK